MRRRLLAAAALALLVAAPLAAAGPWTQPRGDAAATGYQPGGGPTHPDVALRVQLDGTLQPEADAPPLILEDRVVFLARENFDAYDGTYQVYSLDLATGNVSVVGELGVAGALRIATDGETVYAAGPRSVHAFPLEPGGEEWSWSWADETPPTDPGPFEAGCDQMTLDDGHVTVLCWENTDAEASACCGTADEYVSVSSAVADVVLVARLDADTGEPSWVWTRPDPGVNTTRRGTPVTRVFPQGLAVAGDRVVVETIEGVGADGFAFAEVGDRVAGGSGAVAARGRLVVRALDAEDGTPAWDEPWTSPSIPLTEYGTPAGDPLGRGDFPRLVVGNPAVSEDTIYAKAQKVRALNLGTGEEIWNVSIGKQDTEPGLGGGAAVAFADGHVYTTTSQTVHGIDADAPDDRWTKSLDLSADKGFDEDPIVTPSAIYNAALSAGEPGSLYAFGPDDGDVLWEHPIDHNLNSYSVGHGLLAYTDVNFTDDDVTTTIVVLGETEASPEPSASVSTTYPDEGETVRVNLSGTEAGLQGPVTRYKAVWGDGNTTGWQEDPVLSHAYNTSGDHTARLVVGNDANQTASTTATFHVGEDPPPDPNLAQEAAQTALAPENQEITFGVIGIVMAVGGGAIGAARRYHKRSRLQQELDALEEGFEETRSDPGECEAFLDTRKGRARSLALDGKLDEQQAGIVEERAEELRRELRQGAVEDEFGFLPHDLVMKARKMLEDGEVTELEAEAFLQALDDVDFLREEQEALVRERIEDWYGRDAGGGGAG